MQRRHFLSLALASLTAPALAAPALAQTAPAAPRPLDAAERRAVLERLAMVLESDFVFPDTGARYAAMLREKVKAGAYADVTDPDRFGTLVTADLQAVAADGHLALATADFYAGRRPSPPSADAPVSTRATGPSGLEEAKMIGDVAYLRFNMFPGDEATANAARRFLLDHAGAAKAVIIDARPHRGGGMAEMDAILPLFYARETTLVRMDTRASVVAAMGENEAPSLVRQPSPPDLFRQDHVVTPAPMEKRLSTVPVYYLTSRRTASAAEHLALALKRTHRATLIGETTRGAGHYGGVQPIGDRFASFVPVGRTYDPDTGWDWEGKGIAPDIAVPADQALDKALELARTAGANPA